MIKKLFTLCAVIAAALTLPIHAGAATGSAYPSLVLKNQFGETSINSVMPGGSGALDCVFKVDSADEGGAGITGLTGGACNKVFMFTSGTPAEGSPNPAAGYIYVNLKSQFYGFNGAYFSLSTPTTGDSINLNPTGVSAGAAYVITSVGTTTQAQWASIGLPAGVTPAVGAAFIAPANATTAGSGLIQAPATAGAGVMLIDTVGLPSATGQGTAGAWLVLRVMGATASGDTTLVKKAPVNGTIIGLRFVMLPLSGNLK